MICDSAAINLYFNMHLLYCNEFQHLCDILTSE